MSGWIGVDLDGTLAEYHGWNGGAIGEPIRTMLKRVTDWLDAGIEVRIVTARVAEPSAADAQRELIEAWCERYVGEKLPVTASKDFAMIELWDDRCVRVRTNTGERCCLG